MFGEYHSYSKNILNQKLVKNYVCEYQIYNKGTSKNEVKKIKFPSVRMENKRSAAFSTDLEKRTATVSEISDSYVNKRLQLCPNGHYVWEFMTHDILSQCCLLTKNTRTKQNVSEVCKSPPPMFKCRNGIKLHTSILRIPTTQTVSIPYTLVCNGVHDCFQGHDEEFCEIKQCPEFDCYNGQCASFKSICNGKRECANNRDENLCSSQIPLYGNFLNLREAKSMYELIIKEDKRSGCESSREHFVCPGSRCLTVNYFCNGIQDCPGGEDEGPHCYNFHCPGYYRCRGFYACLYISQLCDGRPHCPLSDDEQFCDFSCPHDSCVCRGWEFSCSLPYQVHNYPLVRYVNASRTGMVLDDFNNLNNLIHLDLSHSKTKSVSSTIMMYTLQILDLSFNHISLLVVETFANLPALVELDLSFNPISSMVLHSNENMPSNVRIGYVQ